jgi:hypothetical protein
MRGRERLFATAAIWIAFAVMMNTILDRFIRVSGDFFGLWPPMTFYGELPANNPTVTEMEELINRTGTQIVQQVDHLVSQHMAAYIPVMVILLLALIFAATLSTYFVWRNAYQEADVPATDGVKVKRDGRVQQVMNALDGDELDELRARLVTTQNNHGGQ